MDRETYEETSIKKQEHTNFQCPVCKKGYLVSKTENISMIEYKKYNSEITSCEDSDSEWLKYSFIGKFVCSNSLCQEEYAFGGKAVENHISGEYNTPDGLEYFDDYETELFIEYMERSPQIILIRKEYPTDLNEILESSFRLFWIDLNSCANRIRIYLESLMDIHNIAEKDAGGKFRSLNARLREFCDSGNQYLTEYLHSIRWIGNHASHKALLKRSDVLDIYQILEFILVKLYLPDEAKVIREIADEIIAKSGPRSKIKD